MRAESLLGKATGKGWLTPVPLPRPHDSTATVSNEGLVPSHSEDTGMDSDSYVHLSTTTRVRVRDGANPTLQIDDAEGHALSVCGTSGQLRDIMETISAYLVGIEPKSPTVWTTEEILRSAG